MDLELRRFQREHYPEYASWFSDHELNRVLGPMDNDWLDSVLSEPESQGVTWAVFRGAEMVGVVETVFDTSNNLPTGITAVATKPALRRQGIGAAILEMVLSLHKSKGIVDHVVYIHVDNESGQRCVEKAGFTSVTGRPDKNGYIEYQHHQ